MAGVAQVVGTAGVVLGVTGHCRHQDWWTGSLIEPLFLNWQLGALAVWSGLWIALRQFVRPWPVAARVLRREPVTVDRIVLGAVVALLAATCLLAVAPGIMAQEALVAQGQRPCPAVLSVGRDAVFDRGDRHGGPRVFRKAGHPRGGRHADSGLWPFSASPACWRSRLILSGPVFRVPMGRVGGPARGWPWRWSRCALSPLIGNGRRGPPSADSQRSWQRFPFSSPATGTTRPRPPRPWLGDRASQRWLSPCCGVVAERSAA